MHFRKQENISGGDVIFRIKQGLGMIDMRYTLCEITKLPFLLAFFGGM